MTTNPVSAFPSRGRSTRTKITETLLPATTGLTGWPARVLATDLENRHIQVQAVDGVTQPVEVKVAAGVLLQPQVGDTVWVSGSAGVSAGAWVLMVLARATHVDNPATLSVPGAQHVVLSAPHMRLEGQQSVGLETKNLNVKADHVGLHTGVIRATTYILKFVAQRLNVWGQVIHTQAQSMITRADQRVTRIDGADIMRSDQFVLNSKQLVQIKTEGMVQVKAKGNVTVDGRQIFLG
jgi:hypothetical protein